MESVTNEEALRRIGDERWLLILITNRKKNWIGHVLRVDGIIKEIIEGKDESKTKYRKAKTRMLDELVVVSYGDTKMCVDNRGEWRSWLPWTCREAGH